ncbi:MAG: N-acetyltransferase family protein [Verrucomicrobium sp.]|nr:GNAT family N-acetyltransferase [Verrucomicrobium sp.]
MDFTIRQARPDDAEQLHHHIRRLLHEPGIQIPLQPDEFTLSVDEQRQILAGMPNSACAVCLVAEADRQIIGEINFKGSARRAFSHAVTLGMSVSTEWRNQGVGSRLMTEAIEWAKNTKSVTRIELFVYASNLPAIRLYEKFGFEIEGRRRQAVRQNAELLDDLIMARLLSL